ncbi:glycogen phosphorylase [bacterium (Candidatus Blackallbacteria) CG17_big_fil_post_rev_8_21_14_2_50_48_46]|uniref:Alpha-1,4 glucan phosphorylase n=1 Tax=bacterium (Candidatus Blackallbacteria) CG17_big_fil_post_rev_8_21_14_2_50_48_46 TaxID=2014261 RepID=A0A2M7GBG0_9BACT|nr:MAG: glycogen phosphorylase [bacterium (Candidatus Blackallbacteria) CG18_big_fil_WC_8_21_14_2_50_49_26]PIW19532.1 MAG: glycogen phosphorylase [bacterium (Candidatus Blackallbacteria) CG17_big_fil_post_rev_8_21_14_2_50_48_46]PIW48865.1 MAG: glycogen phosphorylase [bacterium (Candidatus Blackallbacteria) CG13_big_fil_rev_8_21_14_2_50_49_14]
MPTTQFNPAHPNSQDLANELRESFVRNIHHTLAKDAYSAVRWDLFHATALSARERMVDQWLQTLQSYYHQDVKRVYYLSLEFLIGRSLSNTLLNLGLQTQMGQALQEIQLNLSEVEESEWDAGLGNGGLGRLAACYLDSMANTGIPGYGYGIRYEYGIFFQHIRNGYQVETPDNWLRYGNPWEFPRPEFLYPVHFYGRVREYHDDSGRLRHEWVDTESVMAMAYDTPVPGFENGVVNTMRLWSAKSTREFDLEYFNSGDYINAVAHKNESENISKVLYPNDNTLHGRELRLKQEYFFVCATLQDIFRRYLKAHEGFEAFPDKVAIQMNDTHPALTVAELMRLFVDKYHLPWEKAWDLTTRTLAYTNHTVMPEALEKWSVPMLERLLPRHLEIIYEINRRFLETVYLKAPDEPALLNQVSIIEEGLEKKVRMAHLAFVGSHRVNGVSALHSEILKNQIFKDFHSLDRKKLTNVTNGITQRRWLLQCNPELANLINRKQGKGWLRDLSQLKRLLKYETDQDFLQELREIKLHNKQRLSGYIQQRHTLDIDPTSLFDCQTKRLHEYKRQLLLILHMITLYARCKQDPAKITVPRTFIMSGKAAPGYYMAKLIIKLFNAVAERINRDPEMKGRLKAVFLANYSVSLAEKIIPAADLSEQISTAGMEASGTGNMKYALNGALTIGTLDGANVEMREEIGEENIFIFGLQTHEVNALRPHYRPWEAVESDPELHHCLQLIQQDTFSPNERGLFKPILESLLHTDPYFVLADYRAYVDCQGEVEALYQDQEAWSVKMLHNIARMGKFSSDRSVLEYAREIWGVAPLQPQES